MPLDGPLPSHDTSFPKLDQPSLEKYEKAKPLATLFKTPREQMKEEFNLLENVCDLWKPKLDMYRKFDVYSDIHPFKHTAVWLNKLIDQEEGYINANRILSSYGKFDIIATQGPIEETIPAFWRMIVQERVS